jgi:hypothetical protein
MVTFAALAPTGMANTPQHLRSPNFPFMAVHGDLFVRYAALAEMYLFEDPNSSLIKLRQFAEAMAKQRERRNVPSALEQILS